jgi:hypothetical protein
LDAGRRSASVTGSARDPTADLRSLEDRLERSGLAELAPGDLGRSHEHFVGRQRELCQLHDNILTGGPPSDLGAPCSTHT